MPGMPRGMPEQHPEEPKLDLPEVDEDLRFRLGKAAGPTDSFNLLPYEQTSTPGVPDVALIDSIISSWPDYSPPYHMGM